MADRRKAVLVVDDDCELLEMMKILLEGAGYRVITATDGQTALDEVEHGMPALVLLDMKMPGMDGCRFAWELRARHKCLAPVVVLTAAEDASKMAEAIGAEGYLSKPFAINDLLQIVRRHMAARP